MIFFDYIYAVSGARSSRNNCGELKKPIRISRVIFAVLAAFAVFSASDSLAQKHKPEGRFLADSIKLGEPVAYSFVFKHPAGTEVVFPDSTYDFSPFEFHSKKYFPTSTNLVGLSTDSAVYYLSTFEMEPVLRLALPVYVLKKGDSTALEAAPDSVIFVATAPIATGDSVALMVNSDLYGLPLGTDYLLLSVFGIVLLLALGVLYAVFGKRFWAWMRARKLRKKHIAFLKEFERVASANDLGRQDAEYVLTLWKGYVSYLTRMQMRPLTTKEIGLLLGDEKLQNALKSADKLIYAGIQDEGFKNGLLYMRDYATMAYQKREGEI